ncbi:MAG: MoxR family ATPase [Candidatus Omnitrophica bacterium]|nr:MoxR family ATPase [Candidatus Omnitrophota bacterium]
MEKKKVQLNNKLVWPSEPYKPDTGMMPEFVGRESEMELIMAAWIAGKRTLPLSPVLVGEPGVGKNRIVYELARFTGRDIYLFQGHEDITAEDLACTVRFSDDKANMMEYVLSPLVCAMLNGGIFFLDEIGKIRPRALALLVSVLDERRYIDSTLLGERVYAQPGFRFIAATNTGEVSLLPEFIRSRVRPVIKIGYPPRVEIEEIISRQFKPRMDNLATLIEKFWALWDERIKDKIPPTPRDAIAVFSLASSISDFESRGGSEKLKSAIKADAFTLEAGDKPQAVSSKHLEKALRKLYD